MTDDQLVDLKRYFGVVAEGLRQDIQQVAEGVLNLDEKLDRELATLREEHEGTHREIMGVLRTHVRERH